MATLTLIFTKLFDVLAMPFGAHRTAGLVVLSLLTGAGLTLLYRATSNAGRIRRTREVFKARVLEMRLYPDDIVLITRALLGAIAAQGAYLRAAARPILIVAIVAIPVFLQIEARYARAPLSPGASTLVTARLKPGLDARTVPTQLTATGADARVDSFSVRSPATRDVSWRVTVTAPGVHEVAIHTYDQAYRFPLRARADGHAIGGERHARSLAGALTDIGLPEIGRDSALDRVSVGYPVARYRLFGQHMSWLGVFLVATLAGALVPALVLRVAL